MIRTFLFIKQDIHHRTRILTILKTGMSTHLMLTLTQTLQL